MSVFPGLPILVPRLASRVTLAARADARDVIPSYLEVPDSRAPPLQDLLQAAGRPGPQPRRLHPPLSCACGESARLPVTTRPPQRGLRGGIRAVGRPVLAHGECGARGDRMRVDGGGPAVPGPPRVMAVRGDFVHCPGAFGVVEALQDWLLVFNSHTSERPGEILAFVSGASETIALQGLGKLGDVKVVRHKVRWIEHTCDPQENGRSHLTSQAGEH